MMSGSKSPLLSFSVFRRLKLEHVGDEVAPNRCTTIWCSISSFSRSSSGHQENRNAFAVVWVYSYLLEHCFNVCNHGDRLLAEAGEYADQAVSEVRTLQQMIIQRCTLVLRRAVEDHSHFLWFLCKDNQVVGRYHTGFSLVAGICELLSV